MSEHHHTFVVLTGSPSESVHSDDARWNSLVAKTRGKTDFVSTFLGRFVVGYVNGKLVQGETATLDQGIRLLEELDNMVLHDIPKTDMQILKEQLSPESKAFGRNIQVVLDIAHPGSIKHQAVTMILEALA